ncbi:uncharacterized protein LOC133196616 [Saccostrea echinata]|uniref:uncharacterized protein LOC133196616 n=1 Tax=Saccostrea echinata TaxID=191078 RepID=UPI002A82C684|nr:uncharacterized protein LOC133196616 [Saccostrea echinata]
MSADKKRRSSKVGDSNMELTEVQNNETKQENGKIPKKEETKTPTKEKVDKKTDKPKVITVKTAESKHRPNIVDRVEEIMEDIHCCVRVQNKMCFKVFVFLVVLVLDSADLISDWLLFRDVFITEEGLVYGPPEDALTYALLAFSILGTLTFIFEVVNLWWEIFRDNPWVDSDLASTITIWVEDVPQIIINVLIVLCREEAISYFQLVKASVLIIGVVIRIIVSLIRYCSKKNLEEAKKQTAESRRHVAYRVFIMFGLMCILAGSIAVFMLTQFERHPDGAIKFNLPKTAFEGKFHEEKYFDNVSIYLNHPVFDTSTGSSQVDFIRLISIYDIRNKDDKIFKLSYKESSKDTFIIWESDNSDTLQAKECFKINKGTKAVTIESTCSPSYISSPSEFTFKFHFIKPSIPKLIFGDITYNVKVKESGTCHDPTTDIVTKPNKRKGSGNTRTPVIHYYRAHISSESHLLKSKLYQYPTDLTDIAEVWKTGFASCESSGSLAPHRDTSLSTSCS